MGRGGHRLRAVPGEGGVAGGELMTAVPSSWDCRVCAQKRGVAVRMVYDAARAAAQRLSDTQVPLESPACDKSRGGGRCECGERPTGGASIIGSIWSRHPCAGVLRAGGCARKPAPAPRPGGPSLNARGRPSDSRASRQGLPDGAGGQGLPDRLPVAERRFPLAAYALVISEEAARGGPVYDLEQMTSEIMDTAGPSNWPGWPYNTSGSRPARLPSRT